MEGGGGIPLETLTEESQSRHVLPASFEAKSLQKSNWGFFLTGLVGGTLVVVYAVATPFITPALRKVCLPFVPATTKQIENVVKMLQCRRGSLVDIGSGDGRIVIAAAKEGFTAVGYELNPWLVWYSRYRAWREGYFFAVLERCYFRCASDESHSVAQAVVQSCVILAHCSPSLLDSSDHLPQPAKSLGIQACATMSG
ncbi:ATP synthase subunit C lysine N-methyltransferase isoform X6 [Macaca mulatta]